LDVDMDLLERARDLEEEALAAIFDEYYTPLYRYIFYHVSHAQTAEDLTAEVFRRLLEHLHAGRGPRRNLKSWLFRVAHNLVIDEARRFVRRDHQSLDDYLLATDANVERKTQQAILAQQAQQALDLLTPKQRSVIILKYLVGLENTEVADALALPIGAVKSLQHRALAALRRTLARAKTWATEGEIQ
jgi:RNA polymerase sigma-70 factor (ECF subfamily)